MVEDRIAFYIDIASTIDERNENAYYAKLKSYYLMKCKEMGGSTLAAKYFSGIQRCHKCCLEYFYRTIPTTSMMKLSKRQIRRLKAGKFPQNLPPHFKESMDKLLNCNLLIQNCMFCRHVNKDPILKTNKPPKEKVTQNMEIPRLLTVDSKVDQEKRVISVEMRLEPKVTNVYSNAYEVYSLKNEKNNLPKVQPKVIKNNKKKKDKFAGLCRKAVLASAKLKEEKKGQNKTDSRNKLSLFLKPTAK